MNHRLTRALFLIVFIAASLASCSKKEIDLKIVVTTDVHGALFSQNWNNGDPLDGSLSQLAAWVNAQKDEGSSVLLLDNGDLIQGDPAVYFSNFRLPDQANIAARVLNHMQYDAATVGNHDIEMGHPVYDKLVNEFDFPWLAANAIDTEQNKPYFKPYTLVKKSGLKIAIVGLITPRVPTWLPPVLWEGMHFEDMITTAQKWVTHIQEKENPDFLIGLFHSGTNAAYNNPSAESNMNENSSRLVAEKVEGFDIVFAGHDHRHLNEWIINVAGDSVLLMDSRSRVREVAVVSVTGHRGTGARGLRGEHVEFKGIEPDSAFMVDFQGYIDSVQNFVDEPVAELTAPLSSRDAYFGPNPFIDLIHRAQLDLTGADISFAAPLSFSTYLPEGEITVQSLFQLYRYENLLYKIRLSGEEILNFLNYSYERWVEQMSNKNDNLMRMNQQANGQWRFRHPIYNFDSGAGIVYEVDVTKPDGSMVSIFSLSNGEAFDPGKEYTVAINSYRASGGGGHINEGAGVDSEELAKRILSVSENDFRFHLMEWLRKQQQIDPQVISKWKFVPESLVKPAAARDYDRLFGSR